MTESNPVELVCKEVVELVTDYLGGTLSPVDRERFEDHLATCPPCTAYLGQVRTTLELAAELKTEEPTPGAEVAEQLGEMFRRWHGERGR
jgi:predicted anti-sigma-YlaC factor YlaD